MQLRWRMAARSKCDEVGHARCIAIARTDLGRALGVVSFSSARRGQRLAVTMRDGHVSIIDKPYSQHVQSRMVAAAGGLC